MLFVEAADCSTLSRSWRSAAPVRGHDGKSFSALGMAPLKSESRTFRIENRLAFMSAAESLRQRFGSDFRVFRLASIFFSRERPSKSRPYPRRPAPDWRPGDLLVHIPSRRRGRWIGNTGCATTVDNRNTAFASVFAAGLAVSPARRR